MSGSTAPRGAFPMRLLAAATITTLITMAAAITGTLDQHRQLQEAARASLEITRLTGHILLLDEVLTSSAMLAIATGDPSWAARYEAHEVELRQELEALGRAAEEHAQDPAAVRETSEANARLVDWERQALALALTGRHQTAQALLTGGDYEREKARYSAGMAHLTRSLAEIVAGRLEQARTARAGVIAASASLLLALCLLWLMLARSMRSWRNSLEAAEQHARDANRELEQRLLELGSANRQLEEVNHAAAHDLRQPLRTIHAFSQLVAEEGGLSEGQRRNLERVRRASAHMRLLVDDMQAYARIGGRQTRTAMVSLAELLAYLRDDVLVHQIEESGAEFVHGDLPAIPCDEELLMQALQNLISNAIEFRSDAPPRIAVEHESTATEHVIRVSDNGIGVDPSDHEHIFRLFARVGDRRTGNGTGVGLAIVKKAAEAMGGRVTVRSRRGEGAVFSLILPRKEVAEPEAIQR